MANRGGYLIAALVGVIAGSPALADSPARPRSYKVAAGRKHVFVMISPIPVEKEVLPWNEETAAAIREIRRIYTRSGLHRSDGSPEPLWTVDWYAHAVEVASDEVHLIRHGLWAVLPRDRDAPLGSALDQEALSFFANGRLLRTYRIGELVDDTDLLPRSVSHFRWLDEGRLDDARSEYTLTTLDGNRFVFELHAGKIVSESRRGRPAWRGWWVLLGIVGIGAVARITLRRRARPQMVRTDPPGVGTDLPRE
jgi:hypothetical protein